MNQSDIFRRLRAAATRIWVNRAQDSQPVSSKTPYSTSVGDVCSSEYVIAGNEKIVDSEQLKATAKKFRDSDTLAFSEKHKTQSMAYFNEKFRSTFNHACLVHTHKNYMLISDTEFLIPRYGKEVIA